MSTDAENLLASIDALPLEVQREVEVEILDRIAKRGSAAEMVSRCGIDTKTLPPDEWVASLRAWVSGRTVRNLDVDTSRESIYEGRGL